MSVFENLLVGAAFGDDNPERTVYDRCAQILEETGLLAKSNVRAGSLTLLDRKRLELARALSTNPRVLLLDEIAGGLTEHIVHALLAVVDRVMVINFGKKIDDGEPRSVMANRAVKDIYLGPQQDAI
jgi:branched-chain amino acid transport system ATP-binding protein